MWRLPFHAASLMPSPTESDISAAPEISRRLNRASAVIATSVLADSAIEHYRGSFHNKTMFAPLIVATLSLAAGLHGSGDRRSRAHVMRDAIYATAALTGLLGGGMHVYNIAKRPGGISLQNLFYAAPVGAPAALVLSGLFGFLAERLRNGTPGQVPRILGIPMGRLLAAIAGAGLLGTVGEAGLLHYRGAYHDPFMVLPVAVPPVAGVLLGAAAVAPPRPYRVTRLWLAFTGFLGLIGSGFHIMGVGRHMGGWRNWRQTLLAGPPIPAPPAFTGLAMAGLAALRLLEGRNR